MALTTEQRRNLMRYGIPIASLMIPAAMMMKKRARSAGEGPKSKEQMLLESSKIDLQGAMRRALKYLPGSPVEIELEEQHGLPVWEVEIVPTTGGPTREIMIDAKTGSILEMKPEFEGESE